SISGNTCPFRCSSSPGSCRFSCLPLNMVPMASIPSGVSNTAKYAEPIRAAWRRFCCKRCYGRSYPSYPQLGLRWVEVHTAMQPDRIAQEMQGMPLPPLSEEEIAARAAWREEIRARDQLEREMEAWAAQAERQEQERLQAEAEARRAQAQ